MKLYLNGKYVDEKKARISVFDRGFMYGDGIYETLIARNGNIFRLNEHLERLACSAERISLKLPYSKKQFGEIVKKVVKTNKLKSARAKILVSRGVSEPGYFEKSKPLPTVVVAASQFAGWPDTIYDKGVKVAISSVKRNSISSLDPAIKSCNCLNQILAAKDSAKHGAFEAIMLNHDGFVAEGTISNIFILKGNVLMTPHMKTGILGGVTRSAVLELAASNGFICRESFIKPNELTGADECFITSTTLQIVPVVKISSKKIGAGIPGPVTRQLSILLNALINKET